MNEEELLYEIRMIKMHKIDKMNRLPIEHPDYWYNYYMSWRESNMSIHMLLIQHERKAFEDIITN